MVSKVSMNVKLNIMSDHRSWKDKTKATVVKGEEK